MLVNVIVISVIVCIVGFISTEKRNSKKYLPIKNNNMDKEQKNYVLRQLVKYKEMLWHDNNYSNITDVDLIIEKVENGNLSESEINKVNKFLEFLHYRIDIF
ncbi:MAG: hypothetical protein N4A54_04085 [Peptostreptococcaceae bacterium]|nr:hypothetical protein [Peptostreptococcaceae bacterium]